MVIGLLVLVIGFMFILLFFSVVNVILFLCIFIVGNVFICFCVFLLIIMRIKVGYGFVLGLIVLMDSLGCIFGFLFGVFVFKFNMMLFFIIGVVVILVVLLLI